MGVVADTEAFPLGIDVDGVGCSCSVAAALAVAGFPKYLLWQTGER